MHAQLTMISFLLSSFSRYSEGVITISPLRESSVCSGSQLEVSCSTTETFLRWELFSVITESGGTLMTFMRTVSSVGPSSNIEPLTVNSTLFMFSRTSTQDSLPLMSSLLINPVTVDLNGTALNCVRVDMPERSTTSIHIIPESTTLPDLNIWLRSEQFESDNVTIYLEWNGSDSQVYYNVTISPQLSILFNGSTSIRQLVVPYNTFYNVSVTPYLCSRVGTTASIQLNYTKCGSISIDSSDLLTISGYRDPPLTGTNITFSCLPGSIFTGPNSSTCTEEGLWDPDPTQVMCKAKCETPQCVVQVANSITVTGYRDSAQTVMNPSDCCSGILVTTRLNTTACMEEGQWELQLNNTQKLMETISEENTANEVLTITLVCAVFGFAIFSAFMFAIGFLCGHRFGQAGCCKTTDTNQAGYVTPDVPPLPVRRQEQDLELKENVAYEPVHTIHST